MAKLSSVEVVAQRVQMLIEERKEHADAIAEIDNTLHRVGSALTNDRKVASTSQNGVGAVKKKRRKRRRFSVSGEQAVLEFVRKHGSPTTAEINAYWRSQGRSGRADVFLSKLVAAKKLKREAVRDGRGSRYRAT